MKNPKKFARIVYILTYIFLLLLIIAIISLPFLVTWYVEKMGRSPSLATTVMLTCYPLSPFAGIALYSLSRVMKNIVNGIIFCHKNITWMRRISYCCIIAGAAMIISGFFYMPFFVASASALFCGLVSLVFTSILIQSTPPVEDETDIK